MAFGRGFNSRRVHQFPYVAVFWRDVSQICLLGNWPHATPGAARAELDAVSAVFAAAILPSIINLKRNRQAPTRLAREKHLGLHRTRSPGRVITTMVGVCIFYQP
jgi:hypothetical protein